MSDLRQIRLYSGPTEGNDPMDCCLPQFDALTTSLAIFGLPGGTEWIVILVIGLLVFGRRLPEVGRSLGRSIVEFKRGVKGIGDEIDSESGKSTAPPETARITDDSSQQAQTVQEPKVETESPAS
ncbi:MAG: twin-arginine translocase TatA/TatE family subunit [Phycisphaerales bacterium]|nr:twin-arginine translocase TatA/TatE family subunit [Phycisphaerales bacterium]